MIISLTQLFLSIFLFFALTRVYLRFRDGSLSRNGFIFWLNLFGFAIIIILYPNLTSNLAKTIGIGRGADVIVYVSITLLFYLVFRLYVYTQDIRHDITEIIRKSALKDEEKNESKKS